MDELRDEFPNGMSVLAVDNDRICLKILKTLLQKCQYQVITAQNAITALNLLRNNKTKFDLVISDVNMSDMDGFKLLELIALEMDLPVIMLSANDDPKMVMKGISHGACHYLLKPVRINELQNIWQHVIRKKITKIRNQDEPNSDSCNELNSTLTTNEKSSEKRKEHCDDTKEHENKHDNKDTKPHKKPRFVWSIELHRKFLAAVNQLGIHNALPRKILELMNVEKLTRENVSSHLQKYRVNVKRRNSCVANKEANMVETLGNADQSYLIMSSSSDSHNNAFTSFQANEMSNRLHTPTNVNVHGFTSSSGTSQLLQTQPLNNSTNDQLKISLLDNSMCNNDATESPMINSSLPTENDMYFLDNLIAATLEESWDFSFDEFLGMD